MRARMVARLRHPPVGDLILLGVLWRAHEPTVGVAAQRQRRATKRPPSGPPHLLRHFFPALILMTDAIAFGASVVLFANWLCPPPPPARLGSCTLDRPA